MVPVATHAVGSDGGPYIGHTLSGSRQPVLFDPTEASRTARAPACLLAGHARLGQDAAAAADRLPGVPAGLARVRHRPEGRPPARAPAGRAPSGWRSIELSGEERYRGMLDPLRIAPPTTTREDLAANFLLAVLPEPVRPEWQTEIRLAVQSGRCVRRPLLRARSCASSSAARAPPRTPPARWRSTPQPGSPGSASPRRTAKSSRAGRQAADEPADPQPHAAAARAPRARSCSRRSGSARRCCACSPSTRCR